MLQKKSKRSYNLHQPGPISSSWIMVRNIINQKTWGKCQGFPMLTPGAIFREYLQKIGLYWLI